MPTGYDPTDPPYGPHVTPAYGPHTPAARHAAKAAEFQAITAKFDQERARVEAKHAAQDAWEQRLADAAKERAAKERAALDAEMAPRRAELRAQFFMQNAAASDAQFERFWDRVRADEVAAHRERMIEQEVAAQRRNPRFQRIF